MNLSHGHILAAFFAANPIELASGSQWYAEALSHCETIAADTGLPLHAVAGVIAALSPNNKWARNVSDAAALCSIYVAGTAADCASLKVSTFGANKKKALAILAGADPLSVLGGLKVRAFYECILGRDAVCIDGHAYAIWLGRYVPTTATPKISAKLYASISQDYRQATHTINQITGCQYTAAQIQAITWCVWQRIRREVGS